MPDVFGLYVILTDPAVGYEAAAWAAVEEDIRYLQLRMKGRPQEEVFDIARKVRRITRGSQTLFIVNDDPIVAMKTEADGVHLGQDDMPLPEARAVWNAPGKIFGLSTHNEAQEEAARRLRPDYIGVGPVFPTPTKADPDPVIGLERMGAIIKSSPLTTVAIGGIDEENLKSVLDRGAVNFCAVRAIMLSLEPRTVMRRMRDVWRTHRESAGI